MKTTISILLVFFYFGQGMTQELHYEIRGKHTRGVSKEKLLAPQTIGDIRPGYPFTIVESYASTEISVVTSGKVNKATGGNEILTTEQQSLLQLADVGSDIEVVIGYIDQNPVTLFPDIREMQFAMTVVPEIEATYPGGHQELTRYLVKNAFDKMTEEHKKNMNLVVIEFTVTEEGEITNTHVSETSMDPEIDKLLLKVISKMPEWKPAMNAEGRRIRQEFEFIMGANGC